MIQYEYAGGVNYNLLLKQLYLLIKQVLIYY